MNIGQYLEAISESVAAEAKMIRSSFTNSTNKGSGFETVIINLLDEYTSNSIFVSHGEIIDSFGTRTGQIDFAILHDLHPTGKIDGRPNILLFDAVLATGECKTTLNIQHLDSAIELNQKIRKLKIATENNNRLTNNEFTDEPEELSPPYFLIANDCDVKYETLENRLDSGEISLMIALNHTTSKTGLMYLGAEYRNESTSKFCEELATEKVGNNLFETNNPCLSLIWGVNRFQIPQASFTNIYQSYLKIL